ncbi:MAG: hypothetical protein U0892_16805 [Pirellulales bacterium]
MFKMVWGELTGAFQDLSASQFYLHAAASSPVTVTFITKTPNLLIVKVIYVSEQQLNFVRLIHKLRFIASFVEISSISVGHLVYFKFSGTVTRRGLSSAI